MRVGVRVRINPAPLTLTLTPTVTLALTLTLALALTLTRRGAETKRVHGDEEYNEFHHLLIMEALGGDQSWQVRTD